MEAETPDQVNKTSRNSKRTKVSEAMNWADEAAGGEKDVEEGKKALEGDFVVDVSRNSGNSKEAEKVCRICHLSEDSELVLLGCDCRGELGVVHRDCAEAWFLQKGNRLCEICGKMAKNVRSNNREDATALEIESNEMRLVAATLDTADESSRRCKRSFCNLLLGCLLLAFVLPWLLRGIDML
ncbi:E3 ubiquitin-protein ligase MARCH3-like [Sesamum indicum]|uniref:E3 ubiquitin-protein ligase MARCH3-like n=1 Tax=Sesamum indicum TaxID=4182 RepID=A0A6I9UI46_SESIN|nr:E3 ubiquitin-protein ligase MARCH3-like [Sesamum indicum]